MNVYGLIGNTIPENFPPSGKR